MPNKHPRNSHRSLTSNQCLDTKVCSRIFLVNIFITYFVVLHFYATEHFSECENTAQALRDSFKSGLQLEMGDGDTVNSVVTKCTEKSSSGVRKRRSVTFDVEMEITVATILTEESQSVVSDVETIENLVAESLTQTVAEIGETIEFKVVSVELEQKLVEQTSVDEVLIEGNFLGTKVTTQF